MIRALFRQQFEEVVMALPEVVSREQWLEARLRLLAEEKELTRRRDALNAERRKLPMVRVEKIEAYTAGRGWALPWYSSYGSDFNYDFGVTLDQVAGQATYNYRPEPGLAGGKRPTELPGASCFLRDGGEVFHTYSAYARGLDHVDFAYTFLDLTAFGRQEAWEDPKDRAPVIYGTL
jgi:predicted dithiol-disulfide oxidoreductase (DUF899 family)